MCKKEYLPEVIVFAGPNGSGKSTITRLAKTIGKYINADDIKRTNWCSINLIIVYRCSLLNRRLFFYCNAKMVAIERR